MLRLRVNYLSSSSKSTNPLQLTPLSRRTSSPSHFSRSTSFPTSPSAHVHFLSLSLFPFLSMFIFLTEVTETDARTKRDVGVFRLRVISASGKLGLLVRLRARESFPGQLFSVVGIIRASFDNSYRIYGYSRKHRGAASSMFTKLNPDASVMTVHACFVVYNVDLIARRCSMHEIDPYNM